MTKVVLATCRVCGERHWSLAPGVLWRFCQFCSRTVRLRWSPVTGNDGEA